MILCGSKSQTASQSSYQVMTFNTSSNSFDGLRHLVQAIWANRSYMSAQCFLFLLALIHRSLQVLSAGGVPNDTFGALLRQSLNDKIAPLRECTSKADLRRAVEVMANLQYYRTRLPAPAPDTAVLLRTASFSSLEEEDMDVSGSHCALVL